MNKIIISIMFLSLTLLTGCCNPSTDTPPASVKLAETEYSDLSEDLSSYEFKIDGVIYNLPADYSVFVSNGWTLSDEDSTQTIVKGLYTTNSSDLTKDDKTLYAQFLNAGAPSNKITDCKVGSICAYDDKASMILPEGITIGLSVNDLKAAYGEPDEIKIYDSESLKDSRYYQYYPNGENDSRCCFSIGINNKTNLVSSISVSNLSY